MSDTPKSGAGTKGVANEAIDDAKRKILFGAGYGRPPKEHQFKKGQSGNPKGRPKAQVLPMQTALGAALLKEGERVVKLNESGTSSDISMLEAVVRSVGHSAVKGNAYSARTFLQHFDRAEAERKAIIAEEVEWWTEMVAKLRALHELHAAQGKPPPDIFPHPDDVVIDPEKGACFIGPWDKESAAMLDKTIKVRDLLLMQDVWDARNGRGEGECDVTTAAVMELLINQYIPVRFRLSDIELVTRKSRFECTSKRELRKLLFRGWKALGTKWRPDNHFPTIDGFKETWRQAWAAYKALEADSG